jgi:hypothetical protein
MLRAEASPEAGEVEAELTSPLRFSPVRLAPLMAALEDRAVDGAGFDRALATWRFESAQAAMRFLNAISDDQAG